MKIFRALLAAPLFACACAPLSPRLGNAVKFAYMTPPCGGIVALQWPYGYPVPDKKPGNFSFFFYPIEGSFHGPVTVLEPTVNAVVDIDSGTTVSCDVLTQFPQRLKGDRLTPSQKRLSMNKSIALDEKLYDRTEKVGALYSASRPLTAREARLVREFEALFEDNAEPPLLPYYYRLNPDFWEWVRTVAGRSIPKAS